MRSSYYPNYFSLEDILASEERIPVEVSKGIIVVLSILSIFDKSVHDSNIVHGLQVRNDLPDLGYLDPGADLKELKRGTKYSHIF